MRSFTMTGTNSCVRCRPYSRTAAGSRESFVASLVNTGRLVRAASA